MAVRTIVPFGDPILRKPARPVEELNDRTLKTLSDLTDTLYAAEGRAGLASPQIGILRRMVVMDCGDGLIELINPEIVESEGEQTGTEACLSFPGFYGIVRRAQRVKVRTLNRQGESVLLEGEGYLARCMQHEIDHLNGVLFIDHVQEPWLYQEKTGQKIPLLDVIRLSRQGT
jgi:peptide deformylase